ncbi:MAG: RNA dependent RNA polymerase, partial [Cellulosilyticaceae bacterium]
MGLSKQVSIYSLDTSAFYTDYERDLAYLTSKMNRRCEWLKQKIAWIRRKMKHEAETQELFFRRVSLLFKFEDEYETLSIRINKLKNISKQLLIDEFSSKEEGYVRKLRAETLRPHNVISIFDSALTRMLRMSDVNEIYEDMLVVRTYYFQVLKDLVMNGFEHNGEKYILLTASAGQIRTKKAVFIKESLFKRHEKTIMCGLSIDEVNKRGGMNINKWMAYMALVSSATDTWSEFDIDKSIVVDDFETQYNDWVDYIDYESYSIERKKMDVTIPHTDGVGIMLDKNTTMVRLPFVKGLMVYTPFDKFIRTHKRKSKKYQNCSKVKDIYGKEYDIMEDDIRYIFTKSQFKLWKYYDSWDQYKEYFKKYDCEACKCNEEESEFSQARINYQMLQTLTDITDDEIIELCKDTQEEIDSIAKDRKSMLNAFGVEENNVDNSSTSLQKSLSTYPELLQDPHCKEVLKQTKASIVKQGRSGRIRVNGTYTFVSPDTYAFMEWLFLGAENPNGILNTGEVYCDLFDDGIKLDCLRSPQLSLEHAIRVNNRSKEAKKWFTTHCIYTSNRDMISKILQFDVDG